MERADQFDYNLQILSFYNASISLIARLLTSIHDREVIKAQCWGNLGREKVSSSLASKLIERIESGIPGLDRMLDGGIPKGNVIIVAGRAGTGKSVFGAQFLFYGSSMKGERTLYITFTEDKAKFLRYMKSFEMDLDEMESKGLMKVLNLGVPQIGQQARALEEISKAFEEFKPDRAVLDPFSALTIPITGSKGELQSYVNSLIGKIASNINCTTLLISEVPASADQIGSGVEEYIADGIMVLYYLMRGKAKIKAIEVRKMRGTKHSNQATLLEITDKGILVDPDIELT
jgi:circadian clock protein KaiC